MPSPLVALSLTTFQARWVCPVVVLLALLLGAQRGAALHQREPVRVVRAGRQRLGLGHVDGVVLAVDVEVEPRDEEVLVERRVGALVDERPVRRLLALGEAAS